MRYPNVGRIRTLDTHGPWNTKSGGTLMVRTYIPLETVLKEYFSYNSNELQKVPGDIRGLRFYTVRNLPLGQIGGTEFHRIREEMVIGLEGKVRWECEDVYRNKTEFILTQENGIWMPPFILHTYEVLENNSGLFVVANTLFVPDDPRTHDTFSADKFRELQKAVR